MKGDNLMSNIDEIILINENQGKKIKFLEKQKKNCEKHIKDLSESLSLNKQSLSLLASEKKQEAILKLNQENRLLHKNLQQYYEQSLAFPMQLLIEEQLRNEQKKFYNQRIIQFENTMSELRKYLQDKQDSFSAIVARLRKYEDLNEVLLLSKIERFKKDLKEDIIPQVIKDLTEQRNRYKEIYDKFRMNFCDLEILKKCLDDSKSYLQLRQAYLKRRSEIDNGQQIIGKIDENFLSYVEKSKNTTSSSNSFQNMSPSKTNPNKELIRLLKKEKLNNEILQEALNDAIEKNQELVEQNNILIQSNINHELAIENLESKIVILENQLAHYQKGLIWKNQWKSKCDLSKPNIQWRQKFAIRGDEQQIHLQSLKNDINKLSQFVMTCVPTPRLQKSLSSNALGNRNLSLENQKIEEDDIQIEQVV